MTFIKDAAFKTAQLLSRPPAAALSQNCFTQSIREGKYAEPEENDNIEDAAISAWLTNYWPYVYQLKMNPSRLLRVFLAPVSISHQIFLSDGFSYSAVKNNTCWKFTVVALYRFHWRMRNVRQAATASSLICPDGDIQKIDCKSMLKLLMRFFERQALNTEFQNPLLYSQYV